MSPQTFRREEEEESGPEDSPPKKVFEDEEGNPICFFLHKSITSDWQRQNLIHAIESNGGFVQPDDSAVDTVLVDVKSRACNKDNLQLAYNAHSNRSKRRTWVEPMSFVSRCIKERAVRHAQREPKGMGGSLGDRTPFTDEDDDNLARYLAIRIPNIEKGGRRGNRVYKELCLMPSADPEEYGWVKRHTWQSWRNRYNRNDLRFNDMIDAHVEVEKPERKQAYCLQRKYRGWQWRDDSGEETGEQSGNLSKRRRVDSSPDPPENRAKVRYSTNRKGKERAVEDVNDIPREPSPFHEDLAASEPGPSKRVSIKTYGHKSSQRPRLSPSLHDPEPYTSQATLVEPRHQMQGLSPLHKVVSDLPPQQHHHLGVQQSRAPLSLKEPNVSAAPVFSVQVPSAGASTKTVSISPRHRPMARKTAQGSRNPPDSIVIASPPDPPYRNTRSTSRSVELSELLRPKPQPKKGTVSEHHGTTLPSLKESGTEDYQQPVEPMETHPDPMRETLDEEQDVEDLLTRTEDNPSVWNARDGGASQPRYLESDDAQTDDRLRQTQIQAKIRVPRQELDVGPDEMLRRFREASTIRLTPFSPARADPMTTRHRHSAPVVYSQGVFSGISLTEQQPRTPAANSQSQFWRGSTSSEESFPITGTKASAAKKIIETEEKRTPYRPPVGTRAALLTED
ncbi:hypothetical protein E4T56_gene7045 [Termitomyces sp. T112]|nr:hypothetical protein E4T56_gene7045 [Termitomyces sp. T112]